MKNVRFYPPMTEGQLADFLDDLHKAGAAVDDARPHHVAWNGAKYVIASDEDQMRIQLLSTSGIDVTAAWSQIERVHEPWMSTVHGDDEIGADATKTYGPYSKSQADAMLAKIKSMGMTVTGNNPWHIDTNSHGVKLDAAYDGQSITLTITGANFYVSNGKVWDKLDPLMASAKNISGDGTLPVTKAAADAVPTAKAPSTSLDKQESSAMGLGLLLFGIFAIVVLASRE